MIIEKSNNMKSEACEWTLIDFYATWCGPCHTMVPIIERIEKEFENKIHVLKVDVDQLSQLAQHFKVQNVPTLVLLKGGKMVWKQAGILTFGELKKLISDQL